MRLTYKAQDQHGKETGTVWYAITAGSNIFPKSDKEEQVLKKLAAYEDAEEQGRLVMLPEKLYGYYEYDVIGVRYYNGKVTAYYVKNEQVESIIYECEIGDSVFLTREEAEAAWKGGKNNG